MPSAGFEPTMQASERPQAHALDRAVTGIGLVYSILRRRYSKKIGGFDKLR
jgi:hypothetical protein